MAACEGVYEFTNCTHFVHDGTNWIPLVNGHVTLNGMDYVTMAKCSEYNGRKNVIIRSDLNDHGGRKALLKEHLDKCEKPYVDVDSLPDIYSTSSDTSKWPNFYFCQSYNVERSKDWNYNSSAYINNIQASCSVYRNAGLTAKKAYGLEKVMSGTEITLANKVRAVYDAIMIEVTLQDSRKDELNLGINTKLPYSANYDENDLDCFPPIVKKNKDIIAHGPKDDNYNIFVRLNNILMKYSEKQKALKITKKVVNADDSINKLLSNFENGILKDCICYSDCNGYSVCYCYGNCNHY